MARNLKSILMVAIAICATAAISVAGQVTVGTKLKMTNTPNAGTNGEFEVFLKPESSASQTAKNIYNAITPNNATSGGQVFSGKEDFRTFCVEGGSDVEYFVPGRELTVVGVGLNTLSYAAPTNLPELTVKAAALYREFARNQMNGYTFNFFNDNNTSFSYGGASRNTDANLLQNAIWYYLGSISLGTLEQAKANNKYVRAMEENLWYLNTLTRGTNNIGGVSIMNLVDTSKTVGSKAYYAQDQLYYYEPEQPGGFSAVPEPSSMMVFAFGLTACAIRRRSKKS